MWLLSFIIKYSAHIFEGHPFIVEAGVSVGGKDVKQVREIHSRQINSLIA